MTNLKDGQNRSQENGDAKAVSRKAAEAIDNAQEDVKSAVKKTKAEVVSFLSNGRKPHGYEEPSKVINPVILMLLTPTLLFAIYYFSYLPDFRLGELSVKLLWDYFPSPTVAAMSAVVIFLVFEFLLLKFVPGKPFLGPHSPAGDRPTYVLNGVACFFITHAVFLFCSVGLGLFKPSICYDLFPGLVSSLNICAFLLCLALYFKGIYAPSARDNVVLGRFADDYFWGIELYPTVFGISFKQLINSRFGLMGWTVIVVSYAFKQQEIYGHISSSMWVSMILQTLYILKFFVWEGGYFGSIDIIHDRFGYMLCWGCMCWVNLFYTSASLYLVNKPIHLDPFVAAAILIVGIASIWINYDSDLQRQETRATGGNNTIWGQKAKTFPAKYTTEDGEERTNLMLYSGWWGMSRHFNYIPELLLSLCWCLPAGFNSLFPYSYVFYLTILLVDRSFRDEVRCRTKYGPAWDEYCKRVPYRIIPYLF